jgi:hypothetical protein
VTGVTVALPALAAVAAALLVPAGVAKLARPAVARRALGFEHAGADGAVRALGLGELLLAAWVLLVGGPSALTVLGLTYLAFAGVAERQRRRGAGCGCFGADRAVTTTTHVVVDLVAAATAFAAVAATTTEPLRTAIVGDGPVVATGIALSVAVAAATAQRLLTDLPDLAAARRASTGSRR